MDALTVRIRETRPDAPELADLFRRHLTFTRATSPACSVHSKEASDLAGSGARLFVAEEAGRALAMGAILEIGPGHGEIKSMHVTNGVRGRGLGRLVLAELVARAREEGWTRLSLETGSQPEFAPARALYAAAGFQLTGPFAGYREDPNSVYMTSAL